MRDFWCRFPGFGTRRISSALAGSTVNANADASSAFWNPSASFAMDLRPGDTVMDSGMNFVVPSFSFSGKGYAMGQEVSGSDGGNAGVTSYVPNFYLVHQFTENLLGTFAVTSPYGLETDYENDWVGRYQALNSDLVTVDINPSIAYNRRRRLPPIPARRAHAGDPHRSRKGRNRKPSRSKLGSRRQCRIHNKVR